MTCERCNGCDSLNLSIDDQWICEETFQWNDESQYDFMVCETIESLEQCPKGRW